QIKSFSKSFREDKTDFWKSKRLHFGLGSGAVLVGSVVGTPFIGFFAVAGVAAGVFGFYRTYQAHQQVGLWQKDLPQAVALQRKEAFDTGLLTVFKQDELGAKGQPALFSKVLSSVELNGLYLDYLDAFQKDMQKAHQARQKIELLGHAAKYSPLTEGMMNYVRLHPHYGGLLSLYLQENTKFVKTFNTVESLTQDKIEEVKKRAAENISSVEKSKSAALAVAYTTYTLYQRNAERKLNETLASYPVGPQYEQYRVAAQQDYERGLEQARDIRDTSIRLIAFPFNSRIETLRQERDDYIKEIRMNSDAHLLPLFSHVAALHKEAHLVATGAQAPRQAFNPAALYPQFPSFPEMQPVPSAPPMEEVLKQERERYDSRVFDEMLSLYRQEAVSA
ncbi:MAG: hypothetical protein KDK64_01705, partial [Chlamydiia bacterium]|nr:hypothetical protein [Chlamydiia bacterium]